MDKFFFEKPTLDRKKEGLEFIEEFYHYSSEINGTGGLVRFLDNYEGWLEKIHNDEIQFPNEERVPALTYFFVRESDNKIIGMINIRLALNEKLRNYGGNIGYSIRPLERGKGYNKINLYLALKVCEKHGLKEALLDADKDNPASWKTMEALGGKRIREYFNKDSNSIIVDYVIDIKKALREHSEYENYVVNK